MFAIWAILLAAMASPAWADHNGIYDPEFVPAAQASFLQPTDQVVGVSGKGVAKAYPAPLVFRHHIIHDRLGDLPILATWCPACNTALVFGAEVDGQTLTFEDTHKQRGRNLVMVDRQTGSRWQQATGEAFEGPLAGKRLALYPFLLTTWEEWRRREPNTLALKLGWGFDEAKFRGVASSLAFVRFRSPGPHPQGVLRDDGRLLPYEMVMGLEVDGAWKAYPFTRLKLRPVVNDHVGHEPVLVVHQADTDTTTAFSRRLGSRVLTFRLVRVAPVELQDVETESVWDTYGESTRGPLQGQRLTPLTPRPGFWFAWAEFFPATEVYSGSAD